MKDEKRRPVIIDCDPGIDDALGLFMAFASNRLEVVGITTAAGNVPLAHTTDNALRIVELAGQNIEVCQGAAEPLFSKRKTAESVHGKNGIGDVELPESKNKISDRKPFEMIYDEALKNNGELELIATGPLTNIALALLIHPKLSSMIKRIWIMGGAAGSGNRTPAAEFNIYADPYAASIVFKGGIPITMCGLDVTNKALIHEEDIDKLAGYNNKISEKSAQMLKWYLGFYRSFGFSGVAMHDPLTVAAAIDSSIIETKHLYVDIETGGEFTLGKTVVDIHGVSGHKPNADVALVINNDKFKALFQELLQSYE